MMKKLISLLLALTVVCGLCCAALADEVSPKIFYITGNKDVYYWNATYRKDVKNFNFLDALIESGWKNGIMDPDLQVSGLKSSSSRVAKVKALPDGGFSLRIRKAGQATVSFRAKGTKYVYNIDVLKYKNPCMSFKIGKQEYASKFKGDPILEVKEKKLSGRLSVTPASGWQLVDIRMGGKHMENHQKISMKITGNSVLFVTFRKNGTNYGCTLELMLDPYN